MQKWQSQSFRLMNTPAILSISYCKMWLYNYWSFINSAVKDCTFVIHVASPFPMEDPKDEMDVIGPAVEGTRNVLEACAKTKGEVKRVVLTSSCAAIIGKSAVVLRLRKAADILQRHHLHGFPAKWRQRNERRNSILMTRHYPDLGSASDWLLICFSQSGSITLVWVVTGHQYGFSESDVISRGNWKPVVASRNVGCFLRVVVLFPLRRNKS